MRTLIYTRSRRKGTAAAETHKLQEQYCRKWLMKKNRGVCVGVVNDDSDSSGKAVLLSTAKDTKEDYQRLLITSPDLLLDICYARTLKIILQRYGRVLEFAK